MTYQNRTFIQNIVTIDEDISTGDREVCSSGQEPVFLHMRKVAFICEERRK
jgi:hypothetical protein